jgi:hypothetical protein
MVSTSAKIRAKKARQTLICSPNVHKSVNDPIQSGFRLEEMVRKFCGISMLAHFLSFLLISQDFVPFNLRTGKRRERARLNMKRVTQPVLFSGA